MHKYEFSILSALKAKKSLDFDSLVKASGIGRDSALWAIENLAGKKYVEVKKADVEEAQLSEEGDRYAKGSLPEEKLLQRLETRTIKVAELKGKEDMIGLQWAKRKGLVTIDNGMVKISARGVGPSSRGLATGILLRDLASGKRRYSDLGKQEKEYAAELVTRGLVVPKKKALISEVRLTDAGLKALGSEKPADEIDALDRKMIAAQQWKGRNFKKYDTKLKVDPTLAARPNQLRSLLADIRRAYISMGFIETSGPIVEPSYWVFDALFMPQDHPARETQDTFYLSNPEALPFDKSEIERVKKDHESAWHSKWEEEIAGRAVLRTQMTSVSARYMYKILNDIRTGKAEYNLPVKLFSVGRVFRNENLDYKHLTDFYQTDGIIIGKKLTLANLFDTLLSIYDSMGMKIRFAPAYFPFVEPGVEVQILLNGQWLELGGAGIIRREVSGSPRKDMMVLAWGLGVERMLLVKDPSLKSIVELYNTGVGPLRSKPVV